MFDLHKKQMSEKSEATDEEKQLNKKNLEKVLLHMALCHSVIFDERSHKFNASSPDELALVTAAKKLGFVFEKRDEENVISI